MRIPRQGNSSGMERDEFRLKILMVNKFLYPRGGAETYVLELGNYLKEQGHSVEYFGMQDSRNVVGNTLQLGTSPMDFHAEGWKRYGYPFRILYSFEAKRKIRAVAAHFRPDIVHINNINFQLTPSVIDGVRKLGIPIVQTVHDPQILCPNHMMLDLQACVPCERCLDGSVFNCARRRCIHGSFAKSVLGSMEGAIYRKTKHYSRIDRLICPSHFLESLLLRDRRFSGKTTVLTNFSALETGSGKKIFPVFLPPAACVRRFPLLWRGMGRWNRCCVRRRRMSGIWVFSRALLCGNWLRRHGFRSIFRSGMKTVRCRFWNRRLWERRFWQTGSAACPN